MFIMKNLQFIKGLSPTKRQAYRMIANISVKGQTLIPEAIRQQAPISKGGQVNVAHVNGLIVMRKRQPINAALVRKLFLTCTRLPPMTPQAETAVARAIQHLSRQRRQGKWFCTLT